MSAPRVVEAGWGAMQSCAVIRDEQVPVRTLPTGRELTELWHTDQLIASLDVEPGAAHGPFPPANGARLWRLVVPPDDPSNLAPFHATATVDLGFVLSGEVTLELEDGDCAHLVAGDSFVQRGAPHRWVNRSPDAAVLGVVVVGVGAGVGAGGSA